MEKRPPEGSASILCGHNVNSRTALVYLNASRKAKLMESMLPQFVSYYKPTTFFSYLFLVFVRVATNGKNPNPLRSPLWKAVVEGTAESRLV